MIPIQSLSYMATSEHMVTELPLIAKAGSSLAKWFYAD